MTTNHLVYSIPAAAPQTVPQPAASSAGQREALQRVENYLRSQQQRRRLLGADGRVARVEEWGGGDFAYTYDANGDLTALREANGRTRRYQYDARRRLQSVEHGAGQTTRYQYDAQDRLERCDDRGLVTAYGYDGEGRVAKIEHGRSEVSVYRYDEAGRVLLARTAQVSTSWRYDAAGRTVAIEQSLGGVTLAAHFAYDSQGRLASLRLPGSDCVLRYSWDEQGRPLALALAQEEVARFRYDDTCKTSEVVCANGVTAQSVAQMADGRPQALTLQRGEERLLARRLRYDDAGEIVGDGERRYRYDGLGRLAEAQDENGSAVYRYEYDPLDNLRLRSSAAGALRFDCDIEGRLLAARGDNAAGAEFSYDRWGRLVQRNGAGGVWHYRYDDRGCLLEVRRNHAPLAHFLYDHKGRLVWADVAGKVERYLYSDADELLAVTGADGQPLRLLVRTPLGVHAQIQGALGTGAVLFRHSDERGTLRLLTDAAGVVQARFTYDPFGLPLPPSAAQAKRAPACFSGRDWCAAIGLYYFGARWYDPALGRFLTPDSYTGAPDDLRLVNPLLPASRQPALRSQILGEWLKQPRVRNPWAFCGNDPVGRVDPNGHWSFGGVLLMLLGFIWTLPNTLFGILLEITCLAMEVVRWLVWLVSFGHVSWQTPGFDAAASGRLNAFALVFSGGWLGSFSGLLGITFGNVFFVYKEWEKSTYLASLPDPIFPPAYAGAVSIPRQRMLYEHELRHTNQYGWFGPFYHLGLPLFGFYEWDVIIHGYRKAWTERDARAHAEP